MGFHTAEVAKKVLSIKHPPRETNPNSGLARSYQMNLRTVYGG